MAERMTDTRKRRRDAVLAILASGLVLGVGTAMTYAAWVDEEWVFGGNAAGDGPGIGTSVFEVQQDASAPYAAPGTWDDAESNPGNPLLFGLGALALSPGDTVYAPVALSTTPESEGGDLLLQSAVPATGITVVDADDALWGALELSIRAIETTPAGAPPACDAAGFASYTTLVLDAETGLDSGTPAAGPTLDAERGNVVHYCFSVALPLGADDDLQGRTVAPAWQFVSTSD